MESDDVSSLVGEVLLKFALFALTGFGNPVLRNLCGVGLRPELLVTRRESHSYPYYEETQISEDAEKWDVPVFYDLEEPYLRLKERGLDVLLCVTFHKILPAKFLGLANISMNLHPSLLPSYRGASPVYWVLRNGEKKTGVTLHAMTDEVDAGDVFAQKEVAISLDETQGSLRRKLSDLSGSLVCDVMLGIARGEKLHPHAQAHDQASGFPRFSEEFRKIDSAWSPEELDRQVRALSPWPGALREDGSVLTVRGRLP